MNKLLYNETIKHINRSVIESSDFYNYAPNDITWRVHNPVSGITIYFIKNTVPQVSYNISFGFKLEPPFTAAESKQLFEYAEKRYNDHFRGASAEIVNLYKRMLISNNMTRNR